MSVKLSVFWLQIYIPIIVFLVIVIVLKFYGSNRAPAIKLPDSEETEKCWAMELCQDLSRVSLRRLYPSANTEFVNYSPPSEIQRKQASFRNKYPKGGFWSFGYAQEAGEFCCIKVLDKRNSNVHVDNSRFAHILNELLRAHFNYKGEIKVPSCVCDVWHGWFVINVFLVDTSQMICVSNHMLEQSEASIISEIFEVNCSLFSLYLPAIEAAVSGNA